jgi:hypothetical protein
MRYLPGMGMRTFIVAAVIAVSASAATAAERTVSTETAVRFDTRVSAQATARGRVISDYARVGAELPAPGTNMTARSTTVTAADSKLVPAIVYDFE